MKSVPKHYRLVKEHSHSYEIHDARDKKNFHVAKSALDLGMHAKLAKIPHFDEGGEKQDDSEPDRAPAQAPVVVNVGQPAQPAAPPTSAWESLKAGLSGIPNAVSNSATAFENAAGPGEQNVPPANIQSEPAATAVTPVGEPTAPPIAPNLKVVPTLAQQGRANEALSESGIRGIGAADAALEQANVAAYEKENADRQKRFEAFQTARANQDKQITDLANNVMNQKIDPDRWWHDRSIPGKISSAIGVILGGIGAGLQHSNTNQALQVVQDRIRADVDAQKADLGKKQSLLSMNLERYKDMSTAYAATEAQLGSMFAGKLALNAARSGSAKAKANADYAIGQLRNKYLLEAPNLALQDYKVEALHELNGTTAPQNAAGHILGTGEIGTAQPNGDRGPSGSDVLREQKTLQGAPIPNDPYRYGIGVNQNKLTAMKVAGLIDKDDGHKATEEYGKYTKLQHELQEADSVFNIAARNATLRGRISRGLNPHALASVGGAAGAALGATAGSIVPAAGTLAGLGAGATAGAGAGEALGQGIKHLVALGDESTKQYNAVVDPFVDKLAKDVTGRSTPISIEKLSSLMPEQGDSPQTLATKRAKLHDTLKSSYTFPTLMEHKLVNPRDPLLKLDSEGK